MRSRARGTNGWELRSEYCLILILYLLLSMKSKTGETEFDGKIFQYFSLILPNLVPHNSSHSSGARQHLNNLTNFYYTVSIY